ncbi:MAG: DUF2330 domain-containing protein [Actinomycetota bacterium]
MRRVATLTTAGFLVLALAGPALACGGLIGPRGSVNLLRTTTLAAYHGGIEHYVTSFSFAGGGGAFGSLVPLPGVPSKVERGGEWTLQRLVRETQPPQRDAAEFAIRGVAAAVPAKVLLEARIDALDITILEGGGRSVGEWARKNGFVLPPDAPEVLDFYAERSPIFMAARFDADAAAARGQQIGDGTPIHLSIPTGNPWVPLRILGLGKLATEVVQADVYLLTDDRPALLSGEGVRLERGERASDGLIADLRADKGMEWIPATGMWLSYLKVDVPAGKLVHDLAVDASGRGAPSPRAAGLPVVRVPDPGPTRVPTQRWPVIALVGLAATAFLSVAGVRWALR